MFHRKLLTAFMAVVTTVVAGTAAASIGAAPVSAGVVCLTGASGAIGTTTIFNYCGGEQSYVVPAGVSQVRVRVIGAHGGNRFSLGGNGGQVDAIVNVSGGSTLYVLVGGTGNDGGFNGGGSGFAADTRGGGASDIRTTSCAATCPGAVGSGTLASRLVVGAGGGGAGPCGTNGGAGGGQSNGNGNDGGLCAADSGPAATGGTQSAGGTTGGVEGTGGNAATGGGGGGGLYGGGAPAGTRGGAGGSSYGPVGATFTSTANPARVEITPFVATTTTVTSSPSSTNYGESVTFTATVGHPGTATGTVQFYDGASTLGSPVTVGALNKAMLTTSALNVGSHTIKAVYGGDTGSQGSTSADFPYSVGQQDTSTTLGSTGSPTAPGENVTFTATVTPTAGTLDGGSVQFFDGSDPLGAPVAVNTGTGQAVLSTTSLAIGSHTISATYNGSPSFTTSTSPGLAHSVECTPAPCAQPDGRIRRSGGPLLGSNVYNNTGENQAVSMKILAGGVRRIYITLQNDGNLQDEFEVCACGGVGDPSGFTFEYFNGSTDITSEVVAGTYTTGPLSHGDFVRLRVRVTATNLATPGVKISKLITATSSHSAAEDTVAIRVQRRQPN